jgi:hypothetical protein
MFVFSEQVKLCVTLTLLEFQSDTTIKPIGDKIPVSRGTCFHVGVSKHGKNYRGLNHINQWIAKKEEHLNLRTTNYHRLENLIDKREIGSCYSLHALSGSGGGLSLP